MNIYNLRFCKLIALTPMVTSEYSIGSNVSSIVIQRSDNGILKKENI